MALTVDDIRKELQKEGLLPLRGGEVAVMEELQRMEDLQRMVEQRKGDGVQKAKPIRGIPAEITTKWIFYARKNELKEALIKLAGVKDDLEQKSLEELRAIAGDYAHRKRARRKEKAKHLPTRKRNVTRVPPSCPSVCPPFEKPRLVLAETFQCPACGAHLIIEGGRS